MKKKGLFLSLIAAILSVGSLVSCDENTNNNEIVDDGTNNNLNNNENDSKIDDYTVEDNELSRMVYNEFLKSFSDITYEDFKLHGTQFGHNDNISFLYMSSFIETSAGVFVYKKIENNDSYTCSKYINNEWVITDERKYIDGEFKQLYSLELNSDNTFKEKYEYTYDESRKEYTIIKSKYTNDKWEVTYNRTYDYGKSNYKIGIEYESGIPYRKYEIIYDENEKLLNEKISRYVNNSWIEIAEYKYINGICKSSYRITLYAGDVSFCMKEEYEYDENGKSSCYIRSEYKNGEWVYDRKEEYEYSENGQKICTVSKYKNDKWNYDSKNIYVYDGGVLTNEMKYSYVNETWMLSTEYKKINNKWLPSYYISYSNNVPYKYEYIYDENYNRVGCIKSKYTNDEWIYYEKAEYSYNERGRYNYELYYSYVNNEWVYETKKEYEYDENGLEVSCITTKYINGEWVNEWKTENTYTEKNLHLNATTWHYENGAWCYSSKVEHIYDENSNNYSTVISYYVNGEWVYEKKYELIYDKNESKMITYLYLKGEWVQNDIDIEKYGLLE